jgi:hypothetical protein
MAGFKKNSLIYFLGTCPTDIISTLEMFNLAIFKQSLTAFIGKSLVCFSLLYLSSSHAASRDPSTINLYILIKYQHQ